MIRCCLCHKASHAGGYGLEMTDLPGTGWRCIDHDACAVRVRKIVNAHKGLGEVCSG